MRREARREATAALSYDEVVTRLVAVGPTVIDEDWPGHWNHCILATRIGIEVLRYFQIESKPVAVAAMFFNAVMAGALDAGVDPLQARDIPGAWALGIGAVPSDPDQPGSWNGHLVVETEHHLIDLNSGPASRPRRDMPVPSALLMRRPLDFAEGHLYDYKLDDGVRATYRLLNDQRWRRAPDWVGDDRHRKTAGRLIRLIRGVS